MVVERDGRGRFSAHDRADRSLYASGRHRVTDHCRRTEADPGSYAHAFSTTRGDPFYNADEKGVRELEKALSVAEG